MDSTQASRRLEQRARAQRRFITIKAQFVAKFVGDTNWCEAEDAKKERRAELRERLLFEINSIMITSVQRKLLERCLPQNVRP